MARGRGQIPPYGEHFMLRSLRYHPELASRAYFLKRDVNWCIRSDKTSKVWDIWYSNPSGPHAIRMGKPCPSLTAAMARLLAGIEGGFYQVAGSSDRSDHHTRER